MKVCSTWRSWFLHQPTSLGMLWCSKGPPLSTSQRMHHLPSSDQNIRMHVNFTIQFINTLCIWANDELALNVYITMLSKYPPKNEKYLQGHKSNIHGPFKSKYLNDKVFRNIAFLRQCTIITNSVIHCLSEKGTLMLSSLMLDDRSLTRAVKSISKITAVSFHSLTLPREQRIFTSSQRTYLRIDLCVHRKCQVCKVHLSVLIHWRRWARPCRLRHNKPMILVQTRVTSSDGLICYKWTFLVFH